MDPSLRYLPYRIEMQSRARMSSPWQHPFRGQAVVQQHHNLRTPKRDIEKTYPNLKDPLVMICSSHVPKQQLLQNFGLIAVGKYQPFALEKYNPSLLDSSNQKIEKEATSPF